MLMLSAVSVLSQENIFRVRTNPLSTVNFLNGPNVNASFEHRLGGSLWTVNYTVGVYIPHNFLVKKHTNGAFGKLEFRWYEESLKEIFMGFELSGGYHTFYQTHAIGCEDCPTEYYLSERSWVELSYNPGGRILEKNRFFMEFYFSFGARFYNNNVALDKKTADARYFGDWTVPINYREVMGTHLAPKMTVNLRFGFDWR